MSSDAAFMERALFLAERGRGRTSPNPMVGAVVVSPEGVVIGQGAHLEAGGPHAEIHALDAAGDRARGATLYCTLEPCCHTGRTGPCVERIAAAGVTRVVAAVRDPNPRVAGEGFAYLRARGIEVETGQGASTASRQNAPFFTWVAFGRPFVVAKTAVSRDGFVGRADRRVKLTGAVADRWFQRQRAEVDAVAVGSETVLVDDPQLTARDVYRYRPLTRVLYDRRARIPLSARVFSTLAAGPVIMIVSSRAAAERDAHVRSLERLGVSVERIDDGDPPLALHRLADHGILSLLVEGGPRLQMAFIEAHLVDRVQIVTTPAVLTHGVTMPVLAWADRGQPFRTMRFGDDTLREFDVYRTH